MSTSGASGEFPGCWIKSFRHAARPSLALLDQLLEGAGHIGEQARVLAVANPIAGFQQGPREHDVFSHALRPSANLHQRGPVVDRKCTLRNQGALEAAIAPA